MITHCTIGAATGSRTTVGECSRIARIMEYTQRLAVSKVAPNNATGFRTRAAVVGCLNVFASKLLDDR